MLGKEFYIEYGKVIYALALADGEIHPEEEQEIKKMVKEELAPIENGTDEFGTDLAFYALFSFESEDDVTHDTVEDAFNSFLDFLHRRKIKIKPANREVLVRILYNIADSFDGIDQREQKLLDKFKVELETYASGLASPK